MNNEWYKNMFEESECMSEWGTACDHASELKARWMCYDANR